jgi:hypothetical protein
MKRAAWLSLAGIVLASAALAADPPSLVGTWRGMAEGVGSEDGWKQGAVSVVVIEQRGRAVKGYATYPGPSGEGRSDVYGSISVDGKTLVLADEDGSYSGVLSGPDTLDLCYVEAGPDISSKCMQVTRQK